MIESRKDFLSLAGWAAVVAAVSSVSSAWMTAGLQRYSTLLKPSWAVPSSFWSPLWTAFYALMTVAVWRLWRSAAAHASRSAFIFFFIQLGLSALWSWMFFNRQQWAGAALTSGLLLIAVAVTLLVFRSKDRLAALCLWPYFLGVFYVAALTISVWQLN